MEHETEIELSIDNLSDFSEFQKLVDEGRVIADKNGRLRYWHGAPVGKMLFVRLNNAGVPIYKESTDEWFDPESQKAADFRWPESQKEPSRFDK